MSNLLAAVGRGQIEMLSAKVAARKRHFECYAKAFAGVPGIKMMPVDTTGTPNYWLSCILVDSAGLGCSASDVVAKLATMQLEVSKSESWCGGTERDAELRNDVV